MHLLMQWERADKQPNATIIIAATAAEEQDLYGANFLATTRTSEITTAQLNAYIIQLKMPAATSRYELM